MRYIALGLKRDSALNISGLTKHQYYYSPTKGKRGRSKSTHTKKYLDEGLSKVSNTTVVKDILEVLDQPDINYGYQKMTVALQIMGYLINAKKVYRLMKESQLLRAKPKKQAKAYVKYRKVCPDGPLELLEMDIKFVWIESARRHGYILTVIDVFSRQVLGWIAGMSITQHTVKALWTQIILEHLQPNDMLKKGIHIEIRNDNDKRFSARMVQEFFKTNYLNQVFTHPYTPQENGHIESFHAILGRSLNKVLFHTIEDLDIHLHLFYERYNNTRLHGSIAKLPPNIFLDQWYKGNIIRCVDMEKKKARFKLMIPYRYINLSDNKSLKEASCLNNDSLDGNYYSQKQLGDVTTLQPSAQKSPVVASC